MRRHSPPGLRVVIALILVAVGVAAWAALRNSEPQPVDTQGGIAGRIAAGCGRDIAALERASSNRVDGMRTLAATKERLDRILERQQTRLAELRKARLAAQEHAGDGDGARRRAQTAEAREDAANDRYERAMDRRGTASEDLATLLDADGRAADTYQDVVDRCLTTIRDWSLATHALATALAYPARAAGIGQVSVSCDVPVVGASESGHVLYGEGGVIHLAAATCFALERVRARPADLDCARDTATDYPVCPLGALEAADAIITLAHEEQHTDGIDNEAKAECYAYQRAPRAATALGVASAAADRLARVTSLWLEVPPEYHSEQCHSGGGLDLQLPGAGAWSYT